MIQWIKFPLALQEVVECEPAVVIRSGPALVSLLMTLVHVVDACAYLVGQTALNTLSLRTDAVRILSTLASKITCNVEVYEKGKMASLFLTLIVNIHWTQETLPY